MTITVGASGQIQYRVMQMLRQLTAWPDSEVDSSISTLVNREQWCLVQRLASADRRHLFTVHRELVRQGHTDPDLLLAALLHDIGKADEDGRVTILHRILKVALEWTSPDRLSRIARENGNWLTHGLHLALYHPARGAEMARQTGASERTCWLIAHHNDGTIRGDSDLAALQAIDEKG